MHYLILHESIIPIILKLLNGEGRGIITLKIKGYTKGDFVLAESDLDPAPKHPENDEFVCKNHSCRKQIVELLMY